MLDNFLWLKTIVSLREHQIDQFCLNPKEKKKLSLFIQLSSTEQLPYGKATPLPDLLCPVP